jgi:hypothetical protein
MLPLCVACPMRPALAARPGVGAAGVDAFAELGEVELVHAVA